MNEKKMRIGLDYWQVCSHWPYFRDLSAALMAAGHEVYVISGVGDRTRGTVAADVAARGITCTAVHEVWFAHPRESPALKLELCLSLGIGVYYDDRADVCDLLNEHGILALHVPRRRPGQHDLAAERA